ncbi:MAG: histidinol-phosphatase [Candidatus Lambdaproteobacteria bacterium RIFOXYD1_FULL_56_27]|nr:MAG: histidinol-phosphatase [Candidatus Lambdaproteobacteria bacterium RIFOXYC1_FULL_56_13]OGH09628.1 MAG: histidinol-phosphatase [Candidatus Lambdaproteobacteria bacterium RIFOXYD1_FULL_56_27]
MSTVTEPAENKTFQNGATWLRADFHLHTRADKEFVYEGDSDYYASQFVEALKQQGIKLGVITNHNKFDFDEFKTLSKLARKEEIFLLPGVELSVGDGANGIHTLVVFQEEEWLTGGQDYINPFLTSVFPGKTPEEYQRENGRSPFGLLKIIEELVERQKNFFLVFAHVEQASGLWNGVDGGRLSDLGQNPIFRLWALGFQKVRTRDLREKVKGWLGDWYPAEVEGSDCKSIEEIGKGESVYLKLGAFTFGAVKDALTDADNRVAKEPIKHEGSFIVKASFEGGALKGQTIHFASGLNCLIGIRGSGKSFVLEALRYALGMPAGKNDSAYKEQLVRELLGSSGKITLEAVDRYGRPYLIQRILGKPLDTYDDKNCLLPGVSVQETVLNKPLYFGQKDLSSSGEGSEKDLIEKLVGKCLAGIREKIGAQSQRVQQAIEQFKQLSKTEERIDEWKARKLDAGHRLQIFKDLGVEDKLQKQADFDSDSQQGAELVARVGDYLKDLETLIGQHEEELKGQRGYQSKQNGEFFEGILAVYDQLLASFEGVKGSLVAGRQIAGQLAGKLAEFENLKSSLKEEFAAVERTLSEELKKTGKPTPRPDEFLPLRSQVNQAGKMLDALEKQRDQKSKLEMALFQELEALDRLWEEEFNLVKTELAKINQGQTALEIKAEFKGDKQEAVTYMKDYFKGSLLREQAMNSLIERYKDFGTMFANLEEAKEIASSAKTFDEYFFNSLSDLLTWQPKNLYTIYYQGKELKHHSLGQRASALMLFLLSQRENDVVIIDQPEDDLDNQTIYADVIKLVRQVKQRIQFILATHNANFPVLGDAEQVLACSFSDGEVKVQSGSIDCPSLQKKIVQIMEGGKEAFEKRKQKYRLWNPQNS